MSIPKTDKWLSIFNSAVHEYIFNKLEEEKRQLGLYPHDFKQQLRFDTVKSLSQSIKKSKTKTAYYRAYLKASVITPPLVDGTQYDEEKYWAKAEIAKEVHLKILSIEKECNRLEKEENENAKTRKSA